MSFRSCHLHWSVISITLRPILMNVLLKGDSLRLMCNINNNCPREIISLILPYLSFYFSYSGLIDSVQKRPFRDEIYSLGCWVSWSVVVMASTGACDTKAPPYLKKREIAFYKSNKLSKKFKMNNHCISGDATSISTAVKYFLKAHQSSYLRFYPRTNASCWAVLLCIDSRVCLWSFFLAETDDQGCVLRNK